jgi:hypothetical protein
MCWPRPLFACLCACVLLVVPAPAQAVEISGGVSLGGILIGADPRLAVSPHADMSWRLESGVDFSVHDVFNVLPAVNKLGVGVYNQTSIAVGYAWDTANFSVGPSLSIYSIPACANAWCGRVVGLGPGGHAQVSTSASSRRCRVADRVRHSTRCPTPALRPRP